MTGVIGIAGATVTRGNGLWTDGQLAHGLMATIGVFGMVLIGVQLVFISMSQGIFKQSPRKWLYKLYTRCM